MGKVSTHLNEQSKSSRGQTLSLGISCDSLLVQFLDVRSHLLCLNGRAISQRIHIRRPKNLWKNTESQLIAPMRENTHFTLMKRHCLLRCAHHLTVEFVCAPSKSAQCFLAKTHTKYESKSHTLTAQQVRLLERINLRRTLSELLHFAYHKNPHAHQHTITGIWYENKESIKPCFQGTHDAHCPSVCDAHANSHATRICIHANTQAKMAIHKDDSESNGNMHHAHIESNGVRRCSIYVGGRLENLNTDSRQLDQETLKTAHFSNDNTCVTQTAIHMIF